MGDYKKGKEWRSLVRAVFETEDRCWLCGDLVNKGLPKNLPQSPEIDHIIAVSRGGDPLSRDNVRLSHKVCNQKKGYKALSELKTGEFVSPMKVKVDSVVRKRKRSWVE